MLGTTHESEDESRTDASALSSSTEHDHGSKGSELTLRVGDTSVVIARWKIGGSHLVDGIDDCWQLGRSGTFCFQHAHQAKVFEGSDELGASCTECERVAPEEPLESV